VFSLLSPEKASPFTGPYHPSCRVVRVGRNCYTKSCCPGHSFPSENPLSLGYAWQSEGASQMYWLPSDRSLILRDRGDPSPDFGFPFVLARGSPLSQRCLHFRRRGVFRRIFLPPFEIALLVCVMMASAWRLCLDSFS